MPETLVDVEALYAALDSKREAQETSWREVARELDISPSTFSRMAQGRRPDVDTFAGARNFGVTVELFRWRINHTGVVREVQKLKRRAQAAR